MPDQEPMPVVIAAEVQEPIPVILDPESLKGVSGTAGEQGRQGIEGLQGQTGVQGQVGRQGEPGRRGADAPGATVTKGEGTTLSPTTTEADDKVTEGQRHINLIWESTQAVISAAITMAVIYCQINGINSETLNNAFFFVVATYLQRTNHVRQGGVGPKADEVYRGR